MTSLAHEITRLPAELSLNAAARTAGLSRHTLLGVIVAGEVKARESGGRIIVSGASLRAYIARRDKARTRAAEPVRSAELVPA